MSGDGGQRTGRRENVHVVAIELRGVSKLGEAGRFAA
jgi:hypothetical protein